MLSDPLSFDQPKLDLKYPIHLILNNFIVSNQLYHVDDANLHILVHTVLMGSYDFIKSSTFNMDFNLLYTLMAE
eukprot:snap_masked-scaffold_11-processed-gene-9.11-mRNA-1 protein AED:1.00 eAED:1.00 QI:0/-1/0/0/-1/1/1/0/73